MFLVEEVGYSFGNQSPIPKISSAAGMCPRLTSIKRIQSHGLEAIPFPERRASPLPDATHLALATQAVSVCRDGGGMPVLEPNVSPVQVDEEIFIDGVSRTS